MDVDLFDFELPEAQIALRPANPRDSARLMVVEADGAIAHRTMRDLPDYLAAGDTLLVNDTRVIPARLHGQRLRAAGLTQIPAKIEILLHRRLAGDRFSVLARPARKLQAGDQLVFGDLKAEVTARGESGEAELRFALSGAALDAAIASHGEMPLPPYIAGKRKPDARDMSDYQTMFARQDGSVAAPTAGLHFTPELFAALAQKGVSREAVTLHVGLGTFLPVTVQDTAQHRMHAERAVLDPDTAARLNAVHDKGGRIVCVGTTSLRLLESATGEDGVVRPFGAETSIFITPGYRFRAADGLMTNFHLPKSTLFMLVSAFAGQARMKSVYAHAVDDGYRFYSYGDGSLLWRP